MDSNFIVGVLHTIITIFVCSYAFIFPKNNFDFIFIFYTLFIVTSWSSLNGECFITYLMKRKSDIHYIAGQNVHDNSDLYVYPISDKSANMLINIIMIIWWYGTYIVFRRNKYPHILALTFINTWIVYKLLLMTYDNHHNDEEFLWYQRIIFCIFITVIMFTLYYTKKRFIPVKI